MKIFETGQGPDNSSTYDHPVTRDVRAKHVAVEAVKVDGTSFEVCFGCAGSWPCDTIRLCDLVERLERENISMNSFLQGQIQGLQFKIKMLTQQIEDKSNE